VRQTGGRGKYGHVWIELEPQETGTGFTFVDAIVGGVVPREYIPAVENGIREALDNGILGGYPVIDFKATLYDGSYHDVDSDEMSFKFAGSIAFKEAMRKAKAILLEPIMHVRIHVPNDSTSKVNGIVSGRRGQLMGYDARPGWKGWDSVEAQMPMSELQDLIIDLRSLTQGVGTFEMAFDHLAELTGKLAEQITASRRPAA
jgi:elongation factor G